MLRAPEARPLRNDKRHRADQVRRGLSSVRYDRDARIFEFCRFCPV